MRGSGVVASRAALYGAFRSLRKTPETTPETTMRLWIDLTALAAWRGPFTGIEQTVFNLACRYAGRGDAGFFVYDGVDRRFSTIAFDRVHKSVQGEESGAGARVLESVHRAFDRLPLALRDLIPSQASRRVRRILEHVVHRPAEQDEAPFAPGSTVLIPGEGWHDTTMLPELCKRKRRIGFRLASVVYDLMPILYPQFYPPGFSRQYRDYMTTLVSEAQVLLANSRTTRDDVARFCAQAGLRTPETQVFRSGDSLSTRTAVAPDLPIPPGGFMLAVGLEWRKNGILLYQMLKLAKQEGIALPTLVLVGRPAWVRRHHELLTSLFTLDPEINGQVHILTDLDDSRLTWLYQNCRFTIFPSICEGWGLPVAESLRHGKVCLASAACSIPEVGGDLVDYASAYDPRGFLDLARRYLDTRLLSDREAEIRARYRPHDWDMAFAEFDRLLRQSEGKGSDG